MEASVQAASAVDPALARVLTSLAEAAELLGVTEVADLAAETAGRLQALRLEVAVVGEFKRGKSSLINALIGREVLPVGVLPLTSVPTVLEQGEEGLVVEYTDDRQEPYRLDQLACFVTEEMNPRQSPWGGPGDRPAAHPAPGCQCPLGRHPRRRLGA